MRNQAMQRSNYLYKDANYNNSDRKIQETEKQNFILLFFQAVFPS